MEESHKRQGLPRGNDDSRMGGSKGSDAKRLSADDQCRLEELREQCAVLDRRGKPGTIYHDELALLESRAAQPTETISQEDQDDGTA